MTIKSYLLYDTSKISHYLTVQELQVDGDLLLNITDQDLSTDLGMTAGLTRKRQVQPTFQHVRVRPGKVTPLLCLILQVFERLACAEDLRQLLHM